MASNDLINASGVFVACTSWINQDTSAVSPEALKKATRHIAGVALSTPDNQTSHQGRARNGDYSFRADVYPWLSVLKIMNEDGSTVAVLHMNESGVQICDRREDVTDEQLAQIVTLASSASALDRSQ